MDNETREKFAVIAETDARLLREAVEFWYRQPTLDAESLRLELMSLVGMFTERAAILRGEQ